MILIFPLLSAIVYVAGALLLKRAGELGAGTWRMAWVCNTTAAAVFAPLALLGGTVPPISAWWQPVLVGLLFVVGQVFTFRSLQVGDVSVATPVLGVKIILVALLTTVLLGEKLPKAVWVAAALSTGAIALLNATRSASHKHVSLTIALAGLAAAAYAAFDVLVQRWSPAWGVGRFLPIMMGSVGLFSVPMFFLRSREAIPARSARPWLAGGALCLGTQSVMFVATIAKFGQATTANVLYSSRGLWSVLGVWLVGHWFQNREQHLGSRILAFRLVGAALLTIAIVLVVLGRARAS